MAQKITKLRPYQGFCAETSGGIVLASMAVLGIPVSTTHVISSSIMEVGATDKLSAVRWGYCAKDRGCMDLDNFCNSDYLRNDFLSNESHIPVLRKVLLLFKFAYPSYK